jgi:hypothetical protein
MKAAELKAKAKHEFIEYLINVAWLTLVFAAFTVYRRTVLAAHDIVYANYWVALIEGLVLGKVIMFHPLFKLGRRVEAMPLIVPSLFKTFIFTIVVALVKALEHGLKGLWHGVGFMGGLLELSEKWSSELIPNGLVVLVALLPFFMVKELGRVQGQTTLRTLFFLPRADQ